MSEKTRISYIVALLITAISSIVLAVMRCYFLLTAYDPNTGYFTSPYPDIIGIAVGFLVFEIIVYGICLYRKVKIEISSENPSFVFSASFSVIVLFALLLNTIASFTNMTGYRFIAVATVILSVFSITYFIYSIFSPQIHNDKKAILIMTFIGFLIFYIMFRYFTSGFPINSTQKSFELLSLICIVLFALYECRLAFGNEVWIMHIITGMCCVTVGFSFSVSNILYMLVNTNVYDGFTISNFLIFASSIYASVRLYSILSARSLIEETFENQNDYSDFAYASRTEADNFTISEEEPHLQTAQATETESIGESINEKMNDGTEDIILEEPNALYTDTINKTGETSAKEEEK